MYNPSGIGVTTNHGQGLQHVFWLPVQSCKTLVNSFHFVILKESVHTTPVNAAMYPRNANGSLRDDKMVDARDCLPCRGAIPFMENGMIRQKAFR